MPREQAFIRRHTKRPKSFVARHPVAFWLTSSIALGLAVAVTLVLLLGARDKQKEQERQRLTAESLKSGWWAKGVDAERVSHIMRLCDDTSNVLAVSSTGAVSAVNMSYRDVMRIATDNDDPVRRYGRQNIGRQEIGRLIDACEMRSAVYGFDGRFVVIAPGEGAAGLAKITGNKDAGFERFDDRMGLAFYGR